MLSKEEQVEKTTKARTMSSSQAHVFKSNRKFLMNNQQPQFLQDVGDSISPLVPKRVAMWVQAQESINALDRLVHNKSIHTLDPEIQRRARERSGTEEASDSMAPPVGLHSLAEQREELVWSSREENPVQFKVLRINENATSISQQANVVAMNAMRWLMRV